MYLKIDEAVLNNWWRCMYKWMKLYLKIDEDVFKNRNQNIMTDMKHQGLFKSQAESQCLTKGPQQQEIYKNAELHPTKVMQDNVMQDGERKKLQLMSVAYGSHMAMRHCLEANMMSQI